MRFNRQFENKVTKEEYKKFKQYIKKTNKLHSYYLSMKTAYLFKILQVSFLFFCAVLPLGLYIVFLIVFPYLTGYLLNNLNSEQLSILITSLGGLVSFLLLTIIIGSVLFDNKKETDYFNENEYKVFLETQYNHGHKMKWIIILDLIYGVLFLIGFISKDFSAILISTICIFSYSFIVMFHYIKFRKSNPVERYFIYLKSSFKYTRPDLFTAIRTNNNLLRLINDKNSDLLKIFTLHRAAYFSDFDKFLLNIKNKLNNGENVSLEQNIIEEHILALIKNTRCSTQPLLISLLIRLYKENFLDKVHSKNLIKDLGLSLEKLLNTLDSKKLKHLDKLQSFKTEIDDFIKFSFYYPDEFLNLNKIIVDLTILQHSLFLSIQSLITSIGLFHDGKKQTNTDLKNQTLRNKKAKDLNTLNMEATRQIMKKSIVFIENLEKETKRF